LISQLQKGALCPLFFILDDDVVLNKRPLDAKSTKLAAKVLPLQIYFVDASSRRSLPAPDDELFDTIRSAFGYHLDGTIIAIHDPAG